MANKGQDNVFSDRQQLGGVAAGSAVGFNGI